jgi:hypothetical protein
MRKRGKKIKHKRDAFILSKAIAGVQPLQLNQQIDLGIMYRVAFESMLKGYASEDDFEALAVASNIAMMLEETRKDGYMQEIQDAQDALMQCKRRGDTLGRWGLDGKGMQDVATLLAIHDEQLRTATQKAVVNALMQTRARMSTGQVLEY